MWTGLLALALTLGPAVPAELAPVAVEHSLGPEGPAIATYSERTIVAALSINRDEARLVGYTVKDRPYRRALEQEPLRAYEQGLPVQVEVVLHGKDATQLTTRVEAGSICLSHGRDAEPHVQGDTILLHEDVVLVELPELAGFDRISAAVLDEPGAVALRKLGDLQLDRAHFDVAGGKVGYSELAIATDDPGEVDSGFSTAAATILWPENFSDPQIYRVSGNEAETLERINVVVVPDGYTYAQKAVMESHFNQMVAAFRARTPFLEHDRFMNYTLVYAYSQASGADECDCSIVVDTAMGTRFPNDGDVCGGSGNRCLYYGGGGCDTNGEGNIAAAELRAPAADRTIVMVNTPRYGGCGGARAVYSAGNPVATDIAIHELGHSLGGLADEYGGDPGCGNQAGNVNTSLNGSVGAWSEWIGDIGAPRQGGQYYEQCVYRPLDNCMMRSLGPPFCPVCNQQWGRIIFGHFRVHPTAPVASRAPASPLAVPVGQSTPFSVTTRLAQFTTNSITWRIQGPGYPQLTVVSQGNATLDWVFTQPGQYVVQCEVIADTSFIKPQKNAQNVDFAVWQVTASCDNSSGLPDADADGRVDICDNCPNEANADQADTDLDGHGDACDVCPLAVDPGQEDGDVDGVGDLCDNCVLVSNGTQADQDLDQRGDACDNCTGVSNPTQTDFDADGLGNACDACPGDAANDADADGVCGNVDNCPALSYPGQEDGDAGPVVEVRQWAATATASSEWSPTEYSAMQATGPAEIAGSCTDVITNWSPLTGEDIPEWLELGYPSAVAATSVEVHESLEAGFVYQVDLRDSFGDLHTITTGADPTACGEVKAPSFAATSYPVDGVVVYTQALGWEEIDAVELVGLARQSFDGRGDACDNCPRALNADQANADGDSAGDACDCAPSDPLSTRLGEVTGLAAGSPVSGVLRLDWVAVAGGASYQVTRGDVATLGAGYGTCAAQGVTTLSWDDAALPSAGQGFAYLVQGSASCGTSSLGYRSSGQERINTDPGACP
jgi:hypothetical protein